MRFVKLKTLTWNPKWYQKYSCAPQAIWSSSLNMSQSDDARHELKEGWKRKNPEQRQFFPWWNVKPTS